MTNHPTQAGHTAALPADLVGDDAGLIERPSEAIEVLGGPYRQLDEDGVIVGVSRQAIYETLAYLTQLEAQIAKLSARAEKAEADLREIAEITKACGWHHLGGSCGKVANIAAPYRVETDPLVDVFNALGWDRKSKNGDRIERLRAELAKRGVTVGEQTDAK